MSESDEVDLNRPGIPGPSFFSDSGEEVPNEKTILDNLIDLHDRYGRDIPADVLEQYGITQAEYDKWRMDLAAEEIKEREILADAAEVEARDAELRAQGMVPMPPRRSLEEVAAIERRLQEVEEQARRTRELQGQAEWLPNDDNDDLERPRQP
jgi:hypothetical protein